MITSFFEAPEALYFKVVELDTATEGIVATLEPCDDNGELSAIEGYEFIQTEDTAEAGIAIHKYGAIICPSSAVETEFDIDISYMGETYRSSSSFVFTDVPASITFEIVGDTDDPLS